MNLPHRSPTPSSRGLRLFGLAGVIGLLCTLHALPAAANDYDKLGRFEKETVDCGVVFFVVLVAVALDAVLSASCSICIRSNSTCSAFACNFSNSLQGNTTSPRISNS